MSTQEAQKPTIANTSGTGRDETLRQRAVRRSNTDDTLSNTEDREKKDDPENGRDHEAGKQKKSAGHEDHVKNSKQHHHMDTGRPMLATATVGMCHCGAGCILGDIIGEWLVYGTNAAFSSPPRLQWSEMLVDFGFGFCIWQLLSVFVHRTHGWRVGTQGDFSGLQSRCAFAIVFETGLFGWMAIFQIAIFHWELTTPNCNILVDGADW